MGSSWRITVPTVILLSLTGALSLCGPQPAMCADTVDPDDPSTWPPLVEPKTAKLYGDWLFGGSRYGIPDVADVSKIVVELTARDFKDLKSFELPASHYKKVLSHFENAKIDQSPIFSMPEVASLKIWTKDRRFHRVVVFGAAHTPLCFSVQGVRCTLNGPPKDFYDPSRALVEVLRAAEGGK